MEVKSRSLAAQQRGESHVGPLQMFGENTRLGIEAGGHSRTVPPHQSGS